MLKISRLNNYTLYLFTFSLTFEYWNPILNQGGFTITRMFGFLYVISSIPVLSSWINPKKFWLFFFSISLFFTFYSFSSIVNINYVNSIADIISPALLQNLILFVLVTNHLIHRPEIFENVLISYLMGVYLMGLLFLFGIGYDFDMSEGRVSLFGENPNSFGNKAVFAFVLVLHFLFKRRPSNFFYLSVLLTSVLLLFTMVMASGSRGALVIFFVAGLISIYYMKGLKILKVFLYMAGIALVVFSFKYIIDNESIMQNRLLSLIEEGSIGGRDMLIENALYNIAKYPIFGVSRIPLSTTTEFRDPHNVFLAVLLASGLLGFIPFVYFNYKLFSFSYLVLRKKNEFIFIVIYLIFFLLMLKSGGYISSKLLWFSYAIIVGGGLSKLKITC